MVVFSADNIDCGGLVEIQITCFGYDLQFWSTEQSVADDAISSCLTFLVIIGLRAVMLKFARQETEDGATLRTMSPEGRNEISSLTFTLLVSRTRAAWISSIVSPNRGLERRNALYGSATTPWDYCYVSAYEEIGIDQVGNRSRGSPRIGQDS